MTVGEGSDVECTLADGMIVVEVVWRSMVWTCLSILLELVMLEWYRSLETCVYVADGRWGHWNFDWMLRRLHRRHDYHHRRRWARLLQPKDCSSWKKLTSEVARWIDVIDGF